MLLSVLGYLMSCSPAGPGGAGADTAPSSITADSEAPAPTGDTGACTDAPVVDWDNFGQAFLIHQCNGCHAATAPNRYGAPEDVSFDTVEAAWGWAPRILARAAGESPTMPPRGGVSDDDRQRLVWWLACGVPGS